jgi:2-hydroxychromene-2-carboxylate isomerase
MLTVYIDFKSPESYLALQPLLALGEETGCGVKWRPFRCRQRELPEHSPDPGLTASHGRIREAYRQRINRRYAELQGLSLDRPPGDDGTDAALTALLGMDTDATAFVVAAFKAHWQDHQDLDDLNVVASLLASAACDSKQLASDALDHHQHDIEADGIVSEPALVVAGEVFIGRAHIPLVRQLLNQRTE